MPSRGAMDVYEALCRLGPCTPAQLTERLRATSRGTVSHHLSQLRAAGLAEHNGKRGAWSAWSAVEPRSQGPQDWSTMVQVHHELRRLGGMRTARELAHLLDLEEGQVSDAMDQLVRLGAATRRGHHAEVPDPGIGVPAAVEQVVRLWAGERSAAARQATSEHDLTTLIERLVAALG